MSVKFQLVWVVAGLAVFFTFSFLQGARWEREQAVKRENVTLVQQVNESRAAVRELHQMAVSIQSEHLASIERLNAIALDWESSREQQQIQFNRQRAALAALLASRPDLDAGRAGADILRHWNQGNTGNGEADNSDAAPAADSGRVDDALPGTTVGGGRPLGASDCEPRCGHGVISPLPDAAAVSHSGDECVATGGIMELLRGAAPDAIPAGGDVQ